MVSKQICVSIDINLCDLVDEAVKNREIGGVYSRSQFFDYASRCLLKELEEAKLPEAKKLE